MKKYFVMSDIHSFYKPMLAALTEARFDINNEEHILIICGDIFDRGPDTLCVYNFIKSIPDDRCILVQGNHELLYFELLDKDLPDKHDYSNGTVKTFCAIAGVDYKELDPHEIFWAAQLAGKNPTYNEVQLKVKANWKKVLTAVKSHEITEWLKSDRWVNYLELDPFIFVHSFLPVQLRPEFLNKGLNYYPTYNFAEDALELVPEWRTKASSIQWDDAKWGCPWKQFCAGLFNSEIDAGKRLVCGHWHASDFHKKFEADNSNNLELFFGDNLIALDACTAASGFCNVLVIDLDSRKCFDQHNNILGDV